MNVEQLVPTPDICMQLKDAGYKAKTYFTWWHSIKTEEWWLDPIRELPRDIEIMTLPAPTLQELLKELHGRMKGSDAANSSLNDAEKLDFVKIITAQNPVEEAAKLWLVVR